MASIARKGLSIFSQGCVKSDTSLGLLLGFFHSIKTSKIKITRLICSNKLRFHPSHQVKEALATTLCKRNATSLKEQVELTERHAHRRQTAPTGE